MRSCVLFAVGSGMRSVYSLLRAGRDRGDHWACLRGLRWLNGLAVLLVGLLAAPAMAQQAVSITTTIVPGEGGLDPIAISTGIAPAPIRGEVRGAYDSKWGRKIVPCWSITFRDAGRIRATTRADVCNEVDYSVVEACQLSRQGCTQVINGKGIDLCTQRWSGTYPRLTASSGSGLNKNPFDDVCGDRPAVNKNQYDRVFNQCSLRWESLRCRWCSANSSAPCARYCAKKTYICTDGGSTCGPGGCGAGDLPDLNDEEEGWLNKDGSVKCRSKAGNGSPVGGCLPQHANDKDNDGRFDEGDTVEAKARRKGGDCASEQRDLDPDCYEFFCPPGSVMTEGAVSAPGSIQRPVCLIVDACEFNQDITQIKNSNCGCRDGAVWEGDHCDNKGNCESPLVDVNGICQCPAGSARSTTAAGATVCTPVDPGTYTPYTAVSGCVLDTETSQFILDRFGNTMGPALTGLFNNTYGAACSFIAINVVQVGAADLRQRLEAYGPGTCPALALGTVRFGGEVLVKVGNTYYRANSPIAVNTVTPTIMCDWLDAQRENVARVMTFIFNLLALAVVLRGMR